MYLSPEPRNDATRKDVNAASPRRPRARFAVGYPAKSMTIPQPFRETVRSAPSSAQPCGCRRGSRPDLVKYRCAARVSS